MELSHILKEKAQTHLDVAIRKAEDRVRAKYMDNLDEQAEIIYVIREKGNEYKAENYRYIDRFIQDIQRKYDAFDQIQKWQNRKQKKRE